MAKKPTYEELEQRIRDLERAEFEPQEAEEALKKREGYIDSIFRSAPVGIGLVVDRILEKVNKRLCEITGYDEEELIGHSARILYPDDEGFERVGREKYARIAEHGTGEMETRWKRKDGAIIDILLSSTALDLEDWSRGVTFTALDITDHKRAEERLRSTLAELSVIHEHAPIAMMLVDRDRRVRKVNGFAAQFADRPAEEMIGMRGGEALRCLHHLDDPQGCGFGPVCAECHVRKAVLDTFETGVSHNEIEEWLPFPRGESTEKRCLLISTAFLKIDGSERVLVCVQDITERKQAEEALRESEEFTRVVMNHLPIGVAVNSVDPKVEFRYMNDHFPKIYRTTREALAASNSFWDVVYEDSDFRQEIRNRVMEDCASGDPDRMYWEDIPFTRKGEGPFFICARNIPLKDKQVMISTVWDVTERKRAEEALRESRDLLDATQRLAKVGGWVWDVENQTMTWTEQTYRIHGFEPGEFAAFSPEHIERSLSCYDPDDRPVIEAAFLSCEEEGKPYNLEFPLTTADGRRRWIQTMAQPVLDGERVVRVIGNIVDITERKRAEEALKESEQKYRNLVENANEAIFVAQDGKLVFVNPTTTVITGYSAEELQARPFIEFIHEDDREMVADRHVRRLNGEMLPRLYSFRILHRDGSIRWGELSAVMINWNEKPATLNFMSDITERKRDEAALDKERQRFFLLIENVPFGMMIIDREDTFQYINPKFTAQFGYGLKDIPDGKTWLRQAYPDPEYRNRIVSTWKRDRENAKPGESRPRAFSMRSKNGEERIVNFISVTLTSGEVLVVCEDITDRKGAEDALRNSEQRLQAILESNANPIVVYDAEGFPQYLNPAFTEVFGWTLDELIDQRIPFVPEDQKETTAAKIKEIYSSGVPVKFVSQRLTKQGNTLDVIVSAAIIKGGEGDGTGMVVNLTDITEQKNLEQQLRQAQKMESVGRLAGGVAHDFNNMLSVILGYTEMALERVAPTHSFYNSFREIHKAAERSSHLTRQLLAFGRKQTIAPRVLDLNETVGGMLKMLRRLIGEDIDLAWLPGAESWPVRMDPAQIDQILANLCVNARDAIADVGKVTIETGKTAFDKAYCAKHPGFIPGDFVLLAVSDDGCGMDRQTLNNLFEPFFTTKEEDKGTGLGLATVYGIVKQNKGFINVYSEPDQGTTVKIYLPRHEADRERMRKKAPAAPDAQGNETILLVEDEPAILRMTQILLQRLGYTVLNAGTPGEAIELAREYPGEIHLLMTDVVMPEMNGRDLAKNLLSLHPNLKRLFMSGYTANVIAHHGVLDEGVRFIQKPFSKQDLAVKVREALNRD